MLYVFAVPNLLSGAVHANTLESLRKDNRESADSKTRGMRRAFADHPRHVGKAYPKEKSKRVALTVGDARWHRGPPIDEALRENPHLEFYRMPSYSPQPNVIERFWKRLRRRATHNRPFDTIAEMKGSVRNGLRYFQTVRGELLTLINGREEKAATRDTITGNVYEAAVRPGSFLRLGLDREPEILPVRPLLDQEDPGAVSG